MDKIYLDTNIGGIKLDNCIMNASGCNCQYINDIKQLNESQSCAIVSKSCTINSRMGNILPRYYHNDNLSINSMGLPNQGYEYYINASHITKKPYIMSVSSQAIYEKISILNEIDKGLNSVSAIEINVSCPNMIGEPQLAYDFIELEEFLRKITEYDSYEKPIGLKLSPYFDICHFNNAFEVLNRYKNNISFLTCINGIGNGLVLDIEKECPKIKPKRGLGGLGGNIVKPTGLANVNQFAENTNFDIIGCGGITSGEDIFEYILCGAKAVQIGTQLVREGTCVFERLQQELKKIMFDKQYYNITEFCGKLIN